MTMLLPRITDDHGLILLEQLRKKDQETLAGFIQYEHVAQEFPSYGGTPATRSQLEEVRERVVAAAIDIGFPEPRGATTAHLDSHLAVALREALPISPHAASDRGAWTFLTCCLLPDVAAWRFPKGSVNRFLGDVNRNVFRRLWWRVEVLGEPPGDNDPIWGVEDVMVQVMERPRLTGSPEVARDLCLVFRNRMQDRQPAEAENLMRSFLLRVMRKAALTRFELLESDVRLRLLDQIAGTVFDRD